MLALIAGVAVAAAFLGSQVEPAWAPRYLAVLFGPLLLALAAVLSRGSGWTWLALGGVAVAWLVSGPAPAKSNVRTVAATVAPQIRPGDLVASTQPEQVPVLHRYLPAGVRYLTPLGPVADPRLTDWRDGAGEAARRPRRARARAARRPARERSPRPPRHARHPPPLARPLAAGGPHPHPRVARVAARRPAPAPDRPGAALDLPAPAQRGAHAALRGALTCCRP